MTLTRRGAVIAGTLALAGCGNPDEDLAISLPAEAAPGPTSELYDMRRLLVAERLQLARYENLAGLLGPTRARERGLIEREAEIEGRHVEAIEDLVRDLGGRPDAWEPTQGPGDRSAALGELLGIERAVAGAWQDSARTFTGLETRAAAFSLLGCELRQATLLTRLRGGRTKLVKPRAITVDALVTSLGAAIGQVPKP